MKTFIASLILISFMNANANVEGLSKAELDDLMTPDEIAEESGFPRTEYPSEVLSVEDVYNTQAISIFREYPIVVIVNKKAFGYGAQRAQIYEHGILTAEWKVSTGREQWEVSRSGRFYFTTTPVGYFYPYSLIRYHWSQTWDALMEFSVFFNGGIALHATTPSHYSQLGSRASGGCVRLHRTNAQYLFDRVKQEGRGLVPVIKRNGQLSRDRRGNVIRAVKWKTLIIVEQR